MEHTLHKWYLPLWCAVWEFLIAFSEAACHRKIPLQSGEKKSWWAVHKHHGCYVNTHVNMYINPCHPMCTHQAAIRASIKGGNLQQSQAEPASAFRVSFVFLAVVSASALIIDVSACVRQAVMVQPWEVCKGSRVGPQTGSHLLCKTDSSQKGHRREAKKGLQYPRQQFTGLYSAYFNSTSKLYFIILVQTIAKKTLNEIADQPAMFWF